MYTTSSIIVSPDASSSCNSCHDHAWQTVEESRELQLGRQPLGCGQLQHRQALRITRTACYTQHTQTAI